MRRRRLLLWIFVPVGLAGIYALLSTLGGGPSLGGGHRHWDCRFFVRVTGKLVDPETGVGCAGAWVLTIPERSWADDTEMVEEWRGLNAEMEAANVRAAAQGPPWHVTGKALLLAADEMTADGTIDVVVGVPWSVNFVGDERISPTHPPPRHGVEALLVEVEGKDPLVINIPENCGDWTEHPRGDEMGPEPGTSRGRLWATWDLGTLEVKGAP